MGLGTQEGGKEDHIWALSVVGVHVGGQETDKKEGLARRGKDGQRRQTRAHRACFKAYRSQIIKDRKGNSKKGNRAATRAKPNSAITHEKMHICNT